MLDDERSVGSDLSLDSHAFSLDEFSNVNRNNLRVRSTHRKKEAERLEVRLRTQIVYGHVLAYRRRADGQGMRA